MRSIEGKTSARIYTKVEGETYKSCPTPRKHCDWKVIGTWTTFEENQGKVGEGCGLPDGGSEQKEVRRGEDAGKVAAVGGRHFLRWTLPIAVVTGAKGETGRQLKDYTPRKRFIEHMGGGLWRAIIGHRRCCSSPKCLGVALNRNDASKVACGADVVGELILRDHSPMLRERRKISRSPLPSKLSTRDLLDALRRPRRFPPPRPIQSLPSIVVNLTLPAVLELAATSYRTKKEVDDDGKDAKDAGVVKANKGMILQKSVEYIRFVPILVAAQGARNRVLEEQLKSFRGSSAGSASPPPLDLGLGGGWGAHANGLLASMPEGDDESGDGMLPGKRERGRKTKRTNGAALEKGVKTKSPTKRKVKKVEEDEEESDLSDDGSRDGLPLTRLLKAKRKPPPRFPTSSQLKPTRTRNESNDKSALAVLMQSTLFTTTADLAWYIVLDTRDDVQPTNPTLYQHRYHCSSPTDFSPDTTSPLRPSLESLSSTLLPIHSLSSAQAVTYPSNSGSLDSDIPYVNRMASRLPPFRSPSTDLVPKCARASPS
ncbi:hypothetical protein R3P38DRAFT_3351495 [Favolaschia claudopus]|uniref:Uncharacterized protein n=1 Tax=Favolaschia claudopus TaxID=2862362 RepID=A0AAW0C3Z5_9AGAR